MRAAVDEVARAAVPLSGAADDYDSLLDLVGDRRLVLLGEATHGTHEFYRERARITKRLIEERGFTAVAVEADWPDAYRVNRFVLGQSPDLDARTALSDFRRFPAWMWRNTDVVRFVEWLRARNDAHHPQTKARFYGLDLYSLRASMEAVIAYLDTVDPQAASDARARIVVWEHNSHVGDARATEMGSGGELNVGQLARSRWPNDCLLVGFTTHHGQVTAASEWGGPAERKIVRPALPDSHEELLHHAESDRFLLRLGADAAAPLQEVRLERAIGVIYRPETERTSHWFHARLPAQFDVVIHYDRTSAVEPLERTSLWDEGEPPETYPSGL